MLATIGFAGTFLCVPGIRGTPATEIPPVVVHAASKQRPAKGDSFDLAKLQAGARVVYVSSGTKASAFRAIDGDRRTKFRFSSADLHPTLIVELAQNQPLLRVSVVSEIGQGHLDIYLLTELAKNPGDLRNATPLTSIVDPAEDGEAAVDFEPRNTRYVALRWTREKTSNHPFDVAEISAFVFATWKDIPAVFSDPGIHLTGEAGPDFSNKLGTLADPPTVASVSP
jgi:hypothetical protein